MSVREGGRLSSTHFEFVHIDHVSLDQRQGRIVFMIALTGYACRRIHQP